MITLGSFDGITTVFPNTSTNWYFIVNQLVQCDFPDPTTAVYAEATVGLYSNNGLPAGGYLGMCFELEGGGTVVNVGYVLASVVSGVMPVTISGVIGNGNLPETGEYYVGLCMWGGSLNLGTYDVNETLLYTETTFGTESFGPDESRRSHIVANPRAPSDSEGESQKLAK